MQVGGLGGLAVAGIIYTALKNSDTQKKIQDGFIKAMAEQSDKHLAAMEAQATRHLTALQERENSMRQIEKSVRDNLTGQLTQNTVALMEVTKIMERVGHRLDNFK